MRHLPGVKSWVVRRGAFKNCGAPLDGVISEPLLLKPFEIKTWVLHAHGFAPDDDSGRTWFTYVDVVEASERAHAVRVKMAGHAEAWKDD